MFQPQFFYEAGKARSGTALIPFFDSTSVAFGISTRNGDTVVDWGDSSSSNIAPVKMRDYADGSVLSSNFNKSYSSALNGNVSVKFLRGLKDVYSIYLGRLHNSGTQQSKLNILDVETFFKQFPNLFSLCIEEYTYQTTSRMSVIKGDLAKLPNSVERVLINQAEILNAGTDFTLNFSSYTNLSNLKSFRFQDTIITTAQSTIKVIGDVGKLPTSCQLLYLQKASLGSAITYTAGKVWASSFDTLYLPISLTVFENDNLLNDLKNSVTTAIGGKVIYLGGGYRSSASDSAVTFLTGLGFTISGVTRLAFTPQLIVHTDANTYTSGTNWNDLSGNGNHITLVNNYAKDATYGGNIKFTNGSANVNFPSIDSRYFTLIFWIKMDVLTNYNQQFGLGKNSDSVMNQSSFYHHSSSTGHIYSGIGVVPATRFEINNFYNTTSPKMVVLVFSNGVCKLYSNNVLVGTKSTGASVYSTYEKFILGSQNTLNNKLSIVKLFNYPFSDSEITTEFNNNKSRFGL